MALLEAAVVVYLRELYYPGDIRHLFPLRLFHPLDVKVELAREVATLAMLLSVAFLTIRKNPTRIFAAFVFLFGLWDLFYYFWLKILIGWPLHWLEWDILFLIPWAWLGPWICPALIALLFVVWGGLALNERYRARFDRRSLTLFIGGALIGLISFLQPAAAFIRHHGLAEIARFRPGGFLWPVYFAGLLLMGVGLFLTLHRQRPD